MKFPPASPGVHDRELEVAREEIGNSERWEENEHVGGVMGGAYRWWSRRRTRRVGRDRRLEIIALHANAESEQRCLSFSILADSVTETGVAGGCDPGHVFPGQVLAAILDPPVLWAHGHIPCCEMNRNGQISLRGQNGQVHRFGTEIQTRTVLGIRFQLHLQWYLHGVGQHKGRTNIHNFLHVTERDGKHQTDGASAGRQLRQEVKVCVRTGSHLSEEDADLVHRDRNVYALPAGHFD